MQAPTNISSSKYEVILGSFENEEMNSFKLESNKKVINPISRGLRGFLSHFLGNAVALQVEVHSFTGISEKKWIYVQVNDVCKEMKIDTPTWLARAANTIGPRFRKFLLGALSPAPFLQIVPPPRAGSTKGTQNGYQLLRK